MATPSVGPSSELERVQRERDLYARLLELGEAGQPEEVLELALAVAVDGTGARQGYLAVFDPDHRSGDAPRWATAHGLPDTDRAQLQRRFSSTIIGETLVTGRSVIVPSAMGAPRFERQDSVQANRITAVLSAPIGRAFPGILYLQGRAAGGVFTERDEAFVTQLGRHLGRWIDGLVARGQDTLDTDADPTLLHRRGGRFQGLVGRSHALARLFDACRTAARKPVPVLITGAPGTGKTTLARELHLSGPRAQGHFHPVDCARLDAEDAYADLVGRDDREDPGHFAMADGGTLFLDNVDALPWEAQRAVLRLLDEGVWQPLGTDEVVEADLRVVAATSVDLTLAAAQARFQRELLRLLRGTVIQVPGLDERPEDVVPLIDHFGRAAAAEHGVVWTGADESAIRFASERGRFPGHVADLKRAVTYAVARVEGRRPLRDADLVLGEEPVAPQAAEAALLKVRRGAELLSWNEAQAAFKRAYLSMALERYGWSPKPTAEALGIARSRVYTLMQELGLRHGGGDDGKG